MNEELRNAGDLARDPSSYSTLTYAWVLVLSLWGGMVRILREVKLGGKSWKQIVGIFFAELCVSGFAGCMTFFIFESAGVKPLYTAVFTGIAGYMGGRALTGFESLYRARFPKG
jgi:hypothetical protein